MLVCGRREKFKALCLGCSRRRCSFLVNSQLKTFFFKSLSPLQWNSAYGVGAIQAAFSLIPNNAIYGKLTIVQPEPEPSEEDTGPVLESAAAARGLDFRGANSYDENFLGTKVPLPQLSAEQKALLPEVQGATDGVLRYINYSVMFNSERGFPFCTAVNIDCTKAVSLTRGKDTWYKDPRISESIQH